MGIHVQGQQRTKHHYWKLELFPEKNTLVLDKYDNQ